MKIRKERNKGITLIALVVTIIVMIILAGVSVNLLIGDNGIITRAQDARGIFKDAEVKERLQLFHLSQYLGNEDLKELLIKNNMINLEELEQNGIVSLKDSEDIIVIDNYKGLKKFSENVNSGNDYNGKIVYLLSNIDCGASFNEETGELLSGENFNPIGTANCKIEEESNDGSIVFKFNGEFNGLNHTISNMYIKKDEENTYCTALFGYLGENGILENLIISNSYIKGNYEIGAFVGRNKGKILNCVNNSKVIGGKLIGGIAGRSINVIENCINNGDIDASLNQVGGIVANCDFGENVIVRNCKNYGRITSASKTIGGIVGGVYNGNENMPNVNVTISNCENYGKIGNEENNYNEVGGIVGFSRGNINNCINKGEVLGYQQVGGIVGNLRRNNVNGCINEGHINGYEFIGGICGATNYENETKTTLENCRNAGKIDGGRRSIGGVCGSNGGGDILRCSNSGAVELDGENAYYGVAGIAGVSNSPSTNILISECYNTGAITLHVTNSKATQPAGIVGNGGMAENSGLTQTISNCYNTGEIKSIEGEYKAATAGIIYHARNNIIENCYNIGNLVRTEVPHWAGFGILGAIMSGDNNPNNNQVTNCYWLDME